MMPTTDTYNIYYDELLEAVVMEWDGYSTSKQFREGTERMLNLLIRHRSGKVLADTKDMLLIGGEDQQWLQEQFIPRALEFGFRHLAILTSEHYFSKVALESISYKVDQEKLTIRFFDHWNEASQWLQTMAS